MSDFLFDIGDKIKILSEAKIYRQNELKGIDHPTLISSMIFYTGKIATRKFLCSGRFYNIGECEWRKD